MTKVLILGAGVVGVSTAWFLRETGFDVTVIDRAGAAGEGTSFANGAQLSYSKTYPLSNPKTIRSIPQLMLAKDSPIHIKKFNLELMLWGLKFLAESTPKKAAHNAEEVLKIGLRSRELMHMLTQMHEVNFDYTRTGKIFLYTRQSDFDASRHLADEYDHMGVKQRVLTPKQAVELEPALAAMEGKLAGVIYSEIDESGDAKKFSDEMVRLGTEAGVEFLFNTEITDIVVENGKIKTVSGIHAHYVVDCLGVGSNAALEKFGVKLPIYPMKGYSLTVAAKALAPKINITDEAKKVVYSTIGDRLRIAGVAEFAGYDLTVDEKIVGGMLETAKECFPKSGDYSSFKTWAGLRPMTPSSVPVIGKSEKLSNLYFNTGHGMLGWTLALGSAEKLAKMIV